MSQSFRRYAPSIPLRPRRRAGPFLGLGLACLLPAGGLGIAHGAPLRSIRVDGSFADWAGVPSFFDPADDQHDTDHDGPLDSPAYVNHPDVDLLEFKFAHDAENLYAYFRARGSIGRTQKAAPGRRAGRYYAIVTIDVDQDDATGYWLHEGGYYPTSNGYDMNMEIEWYDGAFNTGHYLNHGARNAAELAAAELDQRNGIVRVLPGSYDYYTQWVWFDDLSGQVPLADGSGASITFVSDRGPVVKGVIDVALSADGSEMEMMAPFRGFMKDPQGRPIIALGKTLDVSFSLEASGELAPGAVGNGIWASDTADPITGYYLAPEPAGGALLLLPVAWLMKRTRRRRIPGTGDRPALAG